MIDREPLALSISRSLNQSARSGGPPQMWQFGRLPPWIVTGAVFGALWYMLIVCLAQYWAVEPEYSFGWLVPILCAYLFWFRWRSRPAPAAPQLGLARYVFWVTA